MLEFAKEDKVIDGNVIANELLESLKLEIETLTQGSRIAPCLAFIRVGDDPASVSYVKKKDRIAKTIGIKTHSSIFPNDVSLETVINCIHELNANPEVHGILVQSPLPNNWDSQHVFNQINPLKDVDGFHYQNAGKLYQETEDGFVPCTPLGIIHLLKAVQCSTEGKHVVVLGRSLIVGKPVSLLLLQKGRYGNATVSIFHSHSKKSESLLKQADIVIAAMGKPKWLTADKVKPGVVVIDVGINRIPSSTHSKGYELVGDADFQDLLPIASKITPVPGGVGPMTVACLMANTVKAYKLSLKNIF
jgi:methylenetetrahydrofolate dehydrogenase (NADP+)/methenyltetrahydrofolate cyclohydrolase